MVDKEHKNIKLIFDNLIKIFDELKSIIKNTADKINDKLSLKVNNTDNYGYISLGPTCAALCAAGYGADLSDHDDGQPQQR